MAELNSLSCLPSDVACAEIRWPVAYSYGGFAQVRQLAAHAYFDPLGPISVPAARAADVPAEPAPWAMR